MLPAAFGRLCVETMTPTMLFCRICQPPSGGCVLKQTIWINTTHACDQPPSGGCVLKHLPKRANGVKRYQPPSGGCVLKLQ